MDRYKKQQVIERPETKTLKESLHLKLPTISLFNPASQTEMDDLLNLIKSGFYE